MALSICDNGPPPRVPDPFNLAAHTLAAADTSPDKIALTVARSGTDPSPERWTFGALRSAVLGAAGGLRSAGLKPGDRVILRLGHSPDFPIFFLGAAALGAVPVPTSTTLSAEEVAYIVADTEARLVIRSADIDTPGLDVPEIDPTDITGSPLQAFARTGADDLAYIVYTSGSSGRPKGVAHAHRAAFARRMMWDDWYGLGSTDLVLHAGAFNWTYTLGAGLMDPWAAGASSLIYAGPRDPAIWAELIDTFGATIFAAAPGVYRQLLKSGADLQGLATLRHGLSAGETMAEAVRTDWMTRTGRPVHEALGMTECSTFISGSPGTPAKPGWIGRPQSGRTVALLPLEGGQAPVPCGDTGVIAIDRRDPGLMLGYWRRPKDTETAMRGDWFLTGDLGTMDADGQLRFEGRVDDQMNALGYRVAPEEVETALLRLPGITGAAAVELPVRADLSVIAAFVTAEAPAPTEAELQDHCRQHLADYKIPKIFRVINALPRNPNGKLRRKALIEEYGFKG